MENTYRNYGLGSQQLTAEAVMKAAQQQQYQAVADSPPSGLLQQVRSGVEVCHELLSQLHKFADQYVGIRGDEKSGAIPAPVANGNVEELRDLVMHLQGRLSALCGRLSIL